ncbi:MAG: hypothetical protein ACYTBV_06765 [Planctomycetota bacterium]|jgi:hypothetical protein
MNMTIEERLENLERELAIAKCCSRWLLSAAVLAVVVSVLVWSLVPKIVRANRFILEDKNSKSRATLAVVESGAELFMGDENGELRATLSSDKDGPRLNLYGENGKGDVSLIVGKSGPRLSLYDENGKGRASLGAAKTNTPDGNTITYPESSLLLFGPDGKVIWSAP